MLIQSTLIVGPGQLTFHRTERNRDGSTVTATLKAQRVGTTYVLTLTQDGSPADPSASLTPETIKQIERQLGLN